MANYISTLTGPQMDAALLDMAEHNSEAWAVGTRDGEAVTSADVTYHNNAEYYADQASSAAARAESAVPSGTAGAVFFDRSQTLTEAQQRQARTNIGAQEDIADTLQFENTLAMGSRTFTNTNVATGGAGWYRVAYINLERAASEGQFFQSVGTIYIAGFYSGYKPSKGVFNYLYDGGSAYSSIIQTAGVLSTSPTQIRIGNTSTGHAKGQGYVFVDLYFSNASAGTRFAVSIIADGARGIEMIDPTLITGTPTGETVRATLDIQTIKTGAVNSILTARHHVTGISSLAALKTQLSTWYAEQGAGSLGYYTMATSGNLSPITPTSASLGIEIRAGATNNYGTAVLTSHSSTGAAMFIMALNNGTWTDPVKIG